MYKVVTAQTFKLVHLQNPVYIHKHYLANRGVDLILKKEEGEASKKLRNLSMTSARQNR